MMRKRWISVALLLAVFSAPAADEAADAAPPASGPGLLVNIDGPIGPAISEHVRGALDQARERDAALVILRIDTPGGLDTAMRDIIKAILASPVPVVGYVAPGGARAASAGTYILYATHVAAMSPATNLGAATPIAIGGPPAMPGSDKPKQPGGEKDGENPPPEPQDAAKRKQINDAVAYIRSLAERRGRNADWAEKAVREGASLSAEKALAENVIDLIAADQAALLAALDGREVELPAGKRLLATTDLPIEEVRTTWRTELLAIITNPTVAYMLMMIGIYGLILEGYNPGALVPGVIGGICLLLALFAFQILPVNMAGLALMLLGLALIIAEFQCDVLYRGQKEALADFLPLDSQNWIVQGNALRLDWLSLCPAAGTGVKARADDLFGTPMDQAEIDFANEGGETYVCGNPPYIGDKFQTKEQKDDLKSLKVGKQDVRAVDYIAGWFWKASDYIRAGGRFAFVSTNSICQGVQVPLVWPRIFGNDQEIYFAHENFLWGNNASRNAQVTCVIVGVATTRERKKFIYAENSRKEVEEINSYLTAGETVIVVRSSEPISNVSTMFGGNIPRDKGNLLLTTEEMRILLNDYPEARPLIRPILGSNEFINGLQRFCLWITDADAELAFSIPPIAERLEAIRKYRLHGSERGRAGLDTPYKFERTIVGNQQTIIIPSVSSERRPYLPCGFLNADVRVSNLALAIYDGPIWNLALIASRLHIIWVATVCGKLETRYRYSNTMGWNTFPVPKLTEQQKADLTRCAEDILLAREAHFPKTIAELYDPEKMPENLRHAHDRNDEVLERIYIGRRFKNDTERLEKLFELYTRMTSAKAA